MSLYKGVSDEVLALTLLDWHSGGGSPLYVVGSAMYAGHRAPIDQVRLALADLRTMYEVAVDDGEPEADDLSSLYDELSKRYADELASRNPGALGPSLDYGHNPPEGGIPEGAVTHAGLYDGTSFNLETCDHRELDEETKQEIAEIVEIAQTTPSVPQGSSEYVDEQVQVELTLSDRDPVVPPWARFTETFNLDDMAPAALAHRDEEEVAGGVVHGIDFSQRLPMLLAANPYEEEFDEEVPAEEPEEKERKVIPLPVGTETRRRVETLDGSMQGWAYPITTTTAKGKIKYTGRYLVVWSDGSEEELDRKDVHYVKAKIRASDVFQEYRREKIKFAPGEIGLSASNLLRENDKLVKGREEGYYSLGLMLSPWMVAGVGNLCPFASKGCSTACLNESGQGEIHIKGVRVGADVQDISWVQEFRKRSAMLFMHNRPAFMAMLYEAIGRAVDDVTSRQWVRKKGEQAPNPVYGFNLCIRLNTLSDVQWEDYKYEGLNMMQHFKDQGVMFYDYTKNPVRMEKFLRGEMPENYHLTFSWSEANAPFSFWVLQNGGSVAVPFDTAPIRTREGVPRITKLPPWWNGYKVIDADITDIRFLDRKMFSDEKIVGDRWSQQDLEEFTEQLSLGRGFICGLRLKGNAARRRHWELKEEERQREMLPTENSGGFVQYADDAGMRPEGKRVDQLYVPQENLTDARLYPDLCQTPYPYLCGAGSYEHVLRALSDRMRTMQWEEGFLNLEPKQLRRLGLME